MAKLIKQIYDLVQLATDKGITTYHSNEQIMDCVHQGQMELWRQLVKMYPKDKRVRNDLLPFEVLAPITMTAGIGDIPADFEQEIEAYVTVSSITYPVLFKEAGMFRRRLIDPIDPPSTTNAFARIYNNGGRKIQVAPHITPVQLSYWKKPTKPIFGTTLTSGQYVYDDGTSTDVLWSDTMHDIIVRNALALLGLNMRDGQVQAAGRPTEPKEATL